jgi:hypothetical protein
MMYLYNYVMYIGLILIWEMIDNWLLVPAHSVTSELKIRRGREGSIALPFILFDAPSVLLWPSYLGQVQV